MELVMRNYTWSFLKGGGETGSASEGLFERADVHGDELPSL